MIDLFRQATTHPNGTAFIHDEVVWIYHDLLTGAEQLSPALLARGVRFARAVRLIRVPLPPSARKGGGKQPLRSVQVNEPRLPVHDRPHIVAYWIGDAMLTRSLSMFAALVLSAFSAVALDTSGRLALPRGSVLLGKYKARGVQIYVCRVEGTATEWRFKAPEADLFDARGEPFARHYAGPTWEAPDGSKIVGTALASQPAPKADAIPWLLLSTKSSSGVLAEVRFVRRVNTSGGMGPTGRCPTVGIEQPVFYTADYIFYK